MILFLYNVSPQYIYILRTWYINIIYIKYLIVVINTQNTIYLQFKYIINIDYFLMEDIDIFFSTRTSR